MAQNPIKFLGASGTHQSFGAMLLGSSWAPDLPRPGLSLAACPFTPGTQFFLLSSSVVAGTHSE